MQPQINTDEEEKKNENGKEKIRNDQEREILQPLRGFRMTNKEWRAQKARREQVLALHARRRKGAQLTPAGAGRKHGGTNVPHSMRGMAEWT